jgi:hypothetical protein
VGAQSGAISNFTTAVGYDTQAAGIGSTVVGYRADALGTSATALGHDSSAHGFNAIALGRSARATESGSISVGYKTNSGIGIDSGEGSIALGANTRSQGANAIAIGSDSADADTVGANAQAIDSIVIGADADDANFDRAIVIGKGAAATEGDQVGLKSADTFTLLGTGDVGIGTAAPMGNLDINSGVDDTFLLLSNDTAVWEIKSNAGNGKMTIGNNTTGAKPFKFGPTAVGNLLQVGIVADDEVTISGDLVMTGTLTTGGPTCGGGCDAVFSSDYDLPSIEDHAAQMFANSYLPEVGPTKPLETINVSERMGTMLNELEKAHIYIAQLEAAKKQANHDRDEMKARLSRLEALLSK